MKPLFRLVCFFLLLGALSADLWARNAGGSRGGFSGGGSRSSSFGSGSSSRSSSGSSWGSGSSSSRSSGSSSSGSGSSWGSSSRFSPNSNGSSSSGGTRASEPSSSNSSSGWGTSSSSSTRRSAPNSSATDSALARKVGQGGATFGNRSDAVRDFEQKHAAEYTSRFPTQPASQPSYIPNSTSIGGRNYPVYYDTNQGGYGSWVGNRWSAYDVMRDTLMLNALMGQRNYNYVGGPGYYGGAPGYDGGDYDSRPAQYRQANGGSGAGLVMLVVLIIGGIIVWQYLKARSSIQANPFSAGGAVAGNTAGGTPMPPPRNLSTSTMDKSQAADWLAIQPNSIVTISDAQGIADSMKRGQGVRGIDYTVRSVAEMKQLDGLSTHLLLTLHDEEQPAYLLVKIVDENIDLGLYVEVEGLAPGSRQEIVDRGDLWLFQEPASARNFQVADLRYTTSLRQTLPNDKGGQEEVQYELKGQGELQCSYQEKPARTGMGSDALATVVEYQTDQPVENPEFLVLEVGAKRSTQSYVQFFLGCPVKFSEVDVLPA